MPERPRETLASGTRGDVMTDLLQWRGKSRRGVVAGGTRENTPAELAELLYRRGYRDVTILRDGEEVGGIGWSTEGRRQRVWWGAE